MNATRAVVLSAGLFLAGSASTCVITDYSPSVTVTGSVRTSTGEAIPLSVVQVQSSVSRYRPDTGIVAATGEFSVEVREGLGPKVLDAGTAIVICSPPSGLALLPDTVVLERFILRADRDVVRRADCVLAP